MNLPYGISIDNEGIKYMGKLIPEKWFDEFSINITNGSIERKDDWEKMLDIRRHRE